MATIVRHKGDGRCYILLGTGFGAFRSARPGMIFGDILPNEEQGEYTMVSVSIYLKAFNPVSQQIGSG